ncbi:FAD/NAD(P)-binding domain-containing protein [Amylostereum chailletii]|nr:FAD/NAD(P)-binding domain-containing protein [Amylostereum chailletii]
MLSVRAKTALSPGLVHSQLSRTFTASSSQSVERQRLVILGSGWGGFETLRRVDRKYWDVTVVSPSNHFNFTPLLASASVGTIELRCAVEPVRRYSPEASFYQAWCDNIDFKNKTLECTPATPPLAHGELQPTNSLTTTSSAPTSRVPLEPGRTFTLPYDKLVISVGAYAQTFGIPGVKEHAFFLKHVKDARLIRARILECFEQANQPTMSPEERRNLLHFCIVGGGPTGVEFAAELHDLIQEDVARVLPHLVKETVISLYDVAPSILGTFDAGLAKYAEAKFRRDKIELRTSHHVERVEAGKLHVKELGEVPFGLLVWSTGLAPNPLIETLSGLRKDERTKSVLTDAHLNVLKTDGSPDADVWAIGDAARSDGVALPATAQVAMQKAKYLSKKLNHFASGKSSPAPFEFKNQGALAYLGSMTAIYDRSKAGSGLKHSSGLFAWLLWRSAYVTRTVSLRNKLLIPVYWTLTLIFGRDLTRF